MSIDQPFGVDTDFTTASSGILSSDGDGVTFGGMFWIGYNMDYFTTFRTEVWMP